jgi:hypothetical protein
MCQVRNWQLKKRVRQQAGSYISSCRRVLQIPSPASRFLQIP